MVDASRPRRPTDCRYLTYTLVEGLRQQSLEHMIERMTTSAARGKRGGTSVAGSGIPSPSPDSAAPPVGWATGPLGRVQAAEREIARQTAVRARAVAEFAASRPSSADRQPGEPGCASAATRAARAEILAPVSEWAAQELTIALSITRSAAETLLRHSLVLVEQLPSTLAALEAGVIHTGHLWTFLDRVAAVADPAARAAVEADLLRWLSGRVTTPAQLSDKARRVVLARDPRGAAERLARAIRRRGVFAAPGRDDGMATLTAVLSTPEARACLDVLGRYADALVDADLDPAAGGAQPRTRGQRMADCLVDLVLRPGETDLPTVQAQLLIVASVETLAGGDQPGEVDGQPVPAEVVRALARRFGLVPDDPATEGSLETGSSMPAGGIAPPGDASSPGESPAADDAAPLDARGSEASWERQERELLEQIWALDDRYAAGGIWGGAESPPPEVERAAWERDAAWEEWLARAGLCDDWPDAETDNPGTDADTDADADVLGLDAEDGETGHAPVAGFAATASMATGGGAIPGAWAAADQAVDRASALAERARRAVSRAARAVWAAELQAVDDEAEWAASPAGRLTAARDTVSALEHLTQEQRAAIGDLLLRTGGGGLSDRPRIALVDALSGTLLALTDGPELRRRAHCGRAACRRRDMACTHDLAGRPGLGPPPETHGYRPSAALDRFVRVRDRRCRFAGCRMPVSAGELDHDVRYPLGRTAAGNLTGYCTHHHRGKHQAPGWTYARGADGILTITTPTGLTARTSPPPLLGATASPANDPAPF
jgi:hypothetical protein